MNASDKAIAEILDRYGEDFASNTWVVPGGKARAIQHKCIERMAAKAEIDFDPPTMVRAEADWCVMIVTGSMPLSDGKRRVEWSVGEAAPKNNKNAYPYSMAEKRGKDRVALKLIGLHGLLYSEEEAEDFREPRQARSGDPADRAQYEIDKDNDDETASKRLLREMSAKLWKVRGVEGVKALTDDAQFRQHFRALEEDDRTRLGVLIQERRAA